MISGSQERGGTGPSTHGQMEKGLLYALHQDPCQKWCAAGNFVQQAGTGPVLISLALHLFSNIAGLFKDMKAPLMFLILMWLGQSD